MSLKRIIYEDLVGNLAGKEVGIIIGPRQVGKTTLLGEIAKYCRNRGKKHKYFNLEMPADANYFARDFQTLLDNLCKEKQVILIDEFHYLPNATRLFKSIYDGRKRVKIYASGSSSIEMHKHLKESLAGRRRLFRLFPLSFSEWLPSKSPGIKLPASINSKVSPGNHFKLKTYLEEFIILGGMPGLVHQRNPEDKKRLLLDLVATYIQKDIKALLREEDILSFNRLLIMLAGQEGSLLSENGISQSLNYSLRQVRKDLSILSQTFLLDILRPFFANRGRELKQTNKTYFFDSGLRNAVLRDFRKLNGRPDKGALLESFVFHEIQKNLKITQEIYYWRTREKNEVDFILVQDRIPIAIEVKSHLSKPEIPGGIRQFLNKYPECKIAVIFNNDITKKLNLNGRKIIFLPHYYASLAPGIYDTYY